MNLVGLEIQFNFILHPPEMRERERERERESKVLKFAKKLQTNLTLKDTSIKPPLT